MTSRHTPEDYHVLAAQRGFVWLGPESPDSKTKTSWKCANQHIWKATYKDIRRGTGCPTCFALRRGDSRRFGPDVYFALASSLDMRWIGPEVQNTNMLTRWVCRQGHSLELSYQGLKAAGRCPICRIARNLRRTPDEYHALAAQRGLVWLGPEVNTTKSKTRWQCSHGHIWEARYQGVAKAAISCPECYRTSIGDRTRHGPAQYQTLAQSRDFTWLGPLPAESHTPTGWRCANQHEWQASFSTIRKGSGCPYCAKRVPHAAEDFRAAGASKGAVWLGAKPVRAHDKTRWQCMHGHIWQASIHSIKQGKGCPHCSRRSKVTATDYVRLAEKRGFFWLGPMPKNSACRTRWQCQNGHVWAAVYYNINNGSNCPHCREYVNGAPVSQRQRGLHRMLGGYLNYPVNRYRIDIALITDKLMIAVEYDSWYFHDSERDAQRDQVLLSLGWRVLRIKSGSLLPSGKVLLAALERVIAGERCVEIVLHDWEQNYGVTKRVG